MKNALKKVVVAVLTFEAKVLLRRTKPTIIAVTGSVGKTSTKDAIFSVLKNHRKTRKSQKSFNSEIGVPLSILGLPNAWDNPFSWLKNFFDGFIIAFFSRNYPEVLVLECGVDRPGDMAALTKWLSPDIVVMTRLPDVPVHVEFFGTPEAVVAEKMELLKALKPEGVFVYNHDDIKLQNAVKEVRQSAVGFSRYLPTHFTASSDAIVYHNDEPVGSTFTLTHLDESVPVKVMGSIGMQNAYTFAAAAAVAAQFDISLPEVAQSVLEHQSPQGRMRMISGIKGTLIIDDTYNSSPVAVEAALTSLSEIRGAKRKIAVIGDMLELGQFSSRAHEKVGEQVPKCADVLFTLGVRARKIAETAIEFGMHEKNVFQHEDTARAGRELQAFINPGDVILIKASQGIRAEKIVEEIMAHPETASQLLVRQDSSWKSR
ncbi:MAG: UDP-N-acetylmuramoyl-tripeptide--D-alanyl-D-alanine ligase [Patescibacteria group bacterium]